MEMKTASATTALLPLLPYSCPVTIFSHHPQLWLSTNSITSLSHRHQDLSSHRRRPIAGIRYRRRDSNAGNDDDDDDNDFVRKRRRRQWWSDNPPPEVNQDSGVLEEFIDSVWIFKVFGSFGWMLPAIIVSMLLATGPKSFLMALAIPIGQSALTLAFKKLWGGTRDKPRRKSKRKKSRVSFSSDIELDEEEGKGTRKGAAGYQSWVPRDDESVSKETQDASTFGGWDQLEIPKEFDMAPLRRSARKDRSGRMSREKDKISRRGRKTDMPLLLRLLIAVFPFLGSWTKVL
ncbi:hypothetical protein U1Q18_030333 [Sarracenia purpurea var. burkii]